MVAMVSTWAAVAFAAGVTVGWLAANTGAIAAMGGASAAVAFAAGATVGWLAADTGASAALGGASAAVAFAAGATVDWLAADTGATWPSALTGAFCWGFSALIFCGAAACSLFWSC